MNTSSVLAAVGAYYSARLAEMGPTPRVYCHSAESEHLRFEQLLKLCDLARTGSLGDYGCGYGSLLEYLRHHAFAGEYRGFDFAKTMVEAARAQYGGDARARFGADEAALAGCDYVLASGIFNVKLQTPVADWEAHIRATLDRVAALAARGFAFNLLSCDAGPPAQPPHLYYADPRRLFDLCKRRYSRHVSLLRDYGLHEFTVLVRR